MTVSISQPAPDTTAETGMTDLQRGHMLAAHALASLTCAPLPKVGSWHIDYNGIVSGSLMGDDLDTTRRALADVARLLDDAAWMVRSHLNGKHSVAVSGTYAGVPVEVYNLIRLPAGIEPSVLVAELAAEVAP